MPPKHRPSPPIPKPLEFLVRTRWLPFVLFWALVLGGVAFSQLYRPEASVMRSN
jgi:hypothetical protein